MKKHLTLNPLLCILLSLFVLYLTHGSSRAQTVLNVGSGQTYTTIQAAVNAASATQVDTLNIVSSVMTESNITVNKNVYIRGQGAGNVTVQAAASPGIATNRVFNIAAGYTVTMKNITIKNGRSADGANGSSPSEAGAQGNPAGGIMNQGTLTLINCKLIDNYCGDGGDGGPGVYPPGGPLVPCGDGGIGGSGGGIFNLGQLYLYRCTFTGNRAGTGGTGGTPAPGYPGGTIPGDLNGGPGTAGGNGGSGGDGAAIYNSGTLRIRECTFDSNIGGLGAAGTNGSDGGIGLISAVAAIQSGAGGAGGHGGQGGNGGNGVIYNAATIDSLVNCTFYANQAGSGGNGGNGAYGGAGMPGADSIQNPVLGTPFTGGTGGDGSNGGNGGKGGNAGYGGAYYGASSSTLGYMCNVTATQNVAGAVAGNGGNGGDCGMWGFAGHAIPTPPGSDGQPGQVGTNGSGGNGGNAGYGGAFYVTGASCSVRNSIIAGNSCTPLSGSGGIPGSLIMGNSGAYGNSGLAGLGHDAFGTYVSLGYNVIGKFNNSNFTNGVNNDLCGNNPVPLNAQLGPLADNGGPTKTVIISASSPARDAGTSTGAPALDQRGVSRYGVIDRGAYEYQLPSLTMTDDGNITEGAENGEVITLTVTEDVFNTTINSSGFTLTNLPTGVSKGTVTRTGDHTATITLSGNRTVDYDTDITNVTVSISHTELAGLTSGTLSANSGVTLHAIIESCTISSNGPLYEPTLNGDTINFHLVSDLFTDAVLSAANFTLNDAPAGTSISQAIYIDNNDAWLIIGFTGTDYDADSTHVTVTVTGSETTAGIPLTSDEITFFASLEVGISEQSGESRISVFPNPASESVFITGISGEATAEIYSADGRLLIQTKLNCSSADVQSGLDVSCLDSGIYYIKICNGSEDYIHKLLIR